MLTTKEHFQELVGPNWVVRRVEAKDGRFEITLESWSPAGENLVEEFDFDGTEGDFERKLFDLYLNFNPDEHVEPYINLRGQNGIPSSISDLVADAFNIMSMYQKLHSDVKKIVHDLSRFEFILGQDHDYWVYDNVREAYYCTYEKTEEEAKDMFMNQDIPDDNWVNCEDV